LESKGGEGKGKRYGLVLVGHEAALTEDKVQRLPGLMGNEAMLHHCQLALLHHIETQIVFLIISVYIRKCACCVDEKIGKEERISTSIGEMDWFGA